VPRQLETWLAENRPDCIRHIGNPDDPDRSYLQTLSALGYQNIGLDWYTLADHPFVQAQAQAQAAGLLHWSLLGFTELPSPDVIGIGPGAISSIGGFYSRNESDWQLYQSLLNDDQLPIVCGIELEPDDVMRREIMIMVLTTSCIRVIAIEDKWGISFRQFFASETEQLRVFEQKNWLDWQQDSIRIHVRGYPELTEICRVFDRRARAQLAPSTLSCL
jgi:oxygen-independent coproporphyrinogen-3 oxidase